MNMLKNLPLGFSSVELSAFHTVHIGRFTGIDEMAAIRKMPGILDVHAHVPDPEFFYARGRKQPTVFRFSKGFTIDDVGSLEALGDYYRKRTNRASVLKGANLDQEYWLFESGALIQHTVVKLDCALSVDDLIFLANLLVKFPVSFRCLGGGNQVRTISPFEDIQNVAKKVAQLTHATHAIDVVDCFSFILIDRLSDSLEETLSKDPKLRTELYQSFQRDFHALSVRTIEDWENRYPVSTHGYEENESISPAGILKLNFRNIVAYEYPYSKSIVQRLYLPAVVEIRAWLVTMLQFIDVLEEMVDNHRTNGMSEDSSARIEDFRAGVLDSLDDFKGYVLSNSRRTKNLYDRAVSLYGLDRMLALVGNKIAELDSCMARVRESAKDARERQYLQINTNTMQRIADLSAAQEAGSQAITILTIVGAAAVWLSIAERLSLRIRYTLTGFFLICVFFYMLSRQMESAKFQRKALWRGKLLSKAWIRHASFAAHLKSGAKYKRWRVTEVRDDGDCLVVTAERRSRSLKFGLTPLATDFVKSDWRFSKGKLSGDYPAVIQCEVQVSNGESLSFGNASQEVQRIFCEFVNDVHAYATNKQSEGFIMRGNIPATKVFLEDLVVEPSLVAHTE